MLEAISGSDGKWKGEVTRQEHTRAFVSDRFRARRQHGILRERTPDEDAEFEATALVASEVFD